MTGPLSPKKTAMRVWVSQELLDDARAFQVDLGLVEPTPDERAEAERRHAEYRAREAEREAARERFRTAVDAITEQPARAVLDLHCENARGECEGDDADGYDWQYTDWPCRTVTEIAKHYGITLEGL